MNIIERIFKYLADALGITPEEPPVITDNPPIHMVDGEIKLGDSVAEQTAAQWWGKQ